METALLYEHIELAFKELKKKSELYKPSIFWLDASKEIFLQIKESGIENFRNLPLPLNFFVPTYSYPGNSLNKEIENKIYNCLDEMNATEKQKATIHNFLSGLFHASADYRVYLAADELRKKPLLKDFSESSYGNPREQFEFNGKKFSRSSLNYILGLAFYKKYAEFKNIQKVLEIGGGFGTLGEILKTSGIEGFKYINFDIPPLSYISWNYLDKIYNNDINPIDSMLKNDLINIENLPSCNVFNNWQIEKLVGEIDLFVNFISFQEMEPEIVGNYFEHIKRLNAKWLLLRNLREGKQKKVKPENVGVETPIKKEDYIHMLVNDYKLITTNVVPFGFKTVDGFHSELLLFKKLQ